MFFRTVLFKLFNKIETWEEITTKVGQPTWKSFDYERYARILDDVLARGEKLYSAAYIMPSPPFGNPRKHRNHLLLLEFMMRDGAPRRLARARALREVFEILRGYPSLGDFLAFQFTIDLNYSEVVDFSEMDFVVAGPGARDGIRKCFSDTADLSEFDVCRAHTQIGAKPGGGARRSPREVVEAHRVGLVDSRIVARRRRILSRSSGFSLASSRAASLTRRRSGRLDHQNSLARQSRPRRFERRSEARRPKPASGPPRSPRSSVDACRASSRPGPATGRLAPGSCGS